MDGAERGVKIRASWEVASFREAESFHPLAWLTWLAATLVALSSARNPVYLGLILLCIGWTLRVARSHAYAPLLPLAPWRFALLVVTMSALFNALTAHFGATVLLVLPAWLPLLGGPVTLEALVYGVLNGLVLAGFFAAFTVLYLAVPIQGLIRLLPRAFYPAGVVMTVALAFVPTTLTQFQQIRVAQRLRGHRVRGLRDWLPLFMPLLVGGLERALQLAEAMTARGFAGTRMSPVSPPVSEKLGSFRETALPRLLLIVGLGTLLAGMLARLLWQQKTLSYLLLAAGALLVIWALWLQGRGVRRTSYRAEAWTSRDGLLALSAVLVIGAYLLASAFGRRASLAYTPYPQLSWPPLDPLIIFLTLGLAAPALLGQRRWRRKRDQLTTEQ